MSVSIDEINRLCRTNYNNVSDPVSSGSLEGPVSKYQKKFKEKGPTLLNTWASEHKFKEIPSPSELAYNTPPVQVINNIPLETVQEKNDTSTIFGILSNGKISKSPKLERLQPQENILIDISNNSAVSASKRNQPKSDLNKALLNTLQNDVENNLLGEASDEISKNANSGISADKFGNLKELKIRAIALSIY